MASRQEMTYCLKFIWNKAWSQGVFLPEWKQEHRAVLPKPDKDTYHQCQSYRTVSITSIIGKRFEKMTSARLSSYLESINFDTKQHAYLQGRSTTHALISLIERLQKAILNGKVAAVVFFDFTDAFGNVNREKLIEKLWEKFQIRGKLFLHLCSFLSERTARIKINSLTGEWKESELGTSAGTVLGAILFILHVFDSPESMDPKFADDFTAVTIADTIKELENILQRSINDLENWSDKNDMLLNQGKTQVVLFGRDVEHEIINLLLDSKPVEEKDSKVHLGVLLDSMLTFGKHFDRIFSKAIKSMAK